MRPGLRPAAVCLILLATPPARAADPLEGAFAQVVWPFLATYCLGCHGKDRPKGELDLAAFTDLRTVVAGWAKCLRRS